MKSRLSLGLVLIMVLSLVLSAISCGGGDEGAISARFSASPTSGTPPLAVQFTDQSTGEITAWEWDFDGDGTVDSTEQSPSHTYDATGQYTVSLKVTGPAGSDTDSKAKYIKVAYETQFTLKLNHLLPEDTPTGRLAQEFADRTEEYTEGRVKVEVYPRAILYGWADSWDAAKTGAIDIVMLSDYAVLSDLPYMTVCFLMGLWEDYEHIERFARSSEFNDKIRDTLAGKGLHHLGMFQKTFYSGYTNSVKEITVRKDMAGLRLGIITGQPVLYTDTYAEIVPVEVAREELYSALGTGVIDCIALATPEQASMRVWEYGGKHLWIGAGGIYNQMLAMNPDTWSSLPADIQSIISDQVMPELMDLSYDYMVEEESESIATLAEHLDSVNYETAADRDAMWNWAQSNPVFQGMAAAAGADLIALANSLRPSQD